MVTRRGVWPREGMAKVKEWRLFEDEMILVQRETEAGEAVGLVGGHTAREWLSWYGFLCLELQISEVGFLF